MNKNAISNHHVLENIHYDPIIYSLISSFLSPVLHIWSLPPKLLPVIIIIVAKECFVQILHEKITF